MPIDLETIGKGAYHIDDERDYQFNVAATTPFDWSQPVDFFVLLPIANQNGSSSCVAQTTAEMASILHHAKTGELRLFSARDIYSQIFLPNGGAMLRDGVAALVSQGIMSEEHMVSAPETETHMRDQSGFDAGIAHFDYVGEENERYATVAVTIDEVATAIRDHACVMIGVYGDNADWHTPEPTFNNPSAWGHAICGVGAMMRNGKKVIKFQNHWSAAWGDNGYGYLDEDYFTSGRMIGVYVITDNYLNPHPPMDLTTYQNFLAVDAQQSGAFGLILDGKIKVAGREKYADLMLTFVARNNGNIVGKVRDFTAAEWNAADRIPF